MTQLDDARVGVAPPPGSPTAAGTELPVLDTLRAVGAIAVLTTHVAFWAGAYTANGAWGTLLARLDVGVALFFVLSGFLLSRGWLAGSLDGRRAPRAGGYLWRRFLRIVPVYVVTVVVALSFISDNADRTPRQWVSSLLLLDTFSDTPAPAGLTHMWSLAVEVSFYLVLPALMWVALGRRFRIVRLVVVLAVLVLASAWWHLDGAGRVSTVTSGNQLQWLPSYVAWFALGIALAALHELRARGRAPRLTEPIAALGSQPGACWAMVLGLLLVSATPLAGPSMLSASTPEQSLTKMLLYGAVGALVVVTGVFPASGGNYLRAMTHPFARHLGHISYGLFALHLPVLHLVMHLSDWTLFRVPLVPLWLLTLTASLVVAEVVYRVVERPAMRLRDLRAPSRRRAAAGRSVGAASTSTETSGTSTR